MKKVIIGICAAYILLPVVVNAATTKLICKSVSGDVIFTLDLPQEEYRATGATFTYKQNTLRNIDAGSLQTIFDPLNGVFSLYIAGSDNSRYTYGPAKLWAIPASFQTIARQGEDRHKVYTFKAKLSHAGVQSDKNKQPAEIEVNCQLEYEL